MSSHRRQIDKLKHIGQPLVIGHRGASRLAPENTMAAFRLALESGADGVEFDVRLTRDGIPIIIHDDNLRRTGNSTERIAALSLEELKLYDVGVWRGPGFKGEHVPTLTELFDLFTDEGLLYLEMKSDIAARQQLAETCCEYILVSGLKERVIVECFDLEAIRMVKSIDSSIKTAALFEPGLNAFPMTSGVKLVEKALAVGANEIALNHRLTNERMVMTAIEAELNVVVWTVDDPVWIKRAREYGIEAVITNDPKLMVETKSGRV